jgi:tyrosyl-tRNA synthetase
MDLTNVQFINSSEEINSRPDEYWTLVMDIARKNNLKRIIRCRCGWDFVGGGAVEGGGAQGRGEQGKKGGGRRGGGAGEGGRG